MTLRVRPARASDAGRLSDLYGQLGYPTTPAELVERLPALAGEANAVLVVVDTDDAPLGLATLHLIPSLHHGRHNCYITAFVVDESARGTGVGRALLGAVEAWARARDCRRISVTSAERRDGAHRFYEACGFPYTGRRFVKVLD